ncbi:hypothetical protein EDD15DRAFT_2239765 [Pisolithus albus]|nr:hypothetical protein EDD15DRAFT_2239765 [Pisolithus albus]
MSIILHLLLIWSVLYTLALDSKIVKRCDTGGCYEHLHARYGSIAMFRSSDVPVSVVIRDTSDIPLPSRRLMVLSLQLCSSRRTAFPGAGSLIPAKVPSPDVGWVRSSSRVPCEGSSGYVGTNTTNSPFISVSRVGACANAILTRCLSLLEDPCYVYPVIGCSDEEVVPIPLHPLPSSLRLPRCLSSLRCRGLSNGKGLFLTNVAIASG